MTTAQKIEKFTDSGKFQILMDSILRFSKTEYASIISTGVNIEGKPIKSPLDSFSLIPGSKPPKYLIVQHTTAKLEDLENKWLFDHTTAKGKGKDKRKDGDVIKTGRYAHEIRKKDPNAEFILILTTNRRLSLSDQKQDPLVLKTYQKCQEYSLQCEIWEQSRIIHFLNNTPEGHWLRKEFLGIDAELLSEKLLEMICKINLNRYRQEFFLEDNDFIQREIESIVEQEIKKQNKSLHLLIGESGFGKSTISYHLLKKHIESGGFGLWISVDNLEEGLPLENIIGNVLKQIQSKIRIDSENEIWRFATKQRFFIIIDDLNRSADPSRIIQRIISFLPPKSTKPDKQDVNIPFTIICPIWPKFWTPLSREFQNNPQIHQMQIDKFTLEEAESSILNAFKRCDYQITRLQANQSAKKLGCDPLLIGLFSQSLKRDDPHVSLLANDVIDMFIQRKIDEIAQKSPFLNFEFNQVLSKICIEMLIQKRFFPTFAQIEKWLSEDQKFIQIFRELNQNRTLCFINDEKLVFRHDRIQFYLLTKSMLKILDSDDEIRSNVISEPYYAEILGQSILLKEQTDTQLNEIQEKNILSLFESLKIFGDPSTEYHHKIIEEITAWIKVEKRKNYPNPSIIDEICWIIIETDSNVIIPITDYLPQYYFVQFARIRNCCVNSGVQYCSNYNLFEPGIRSSLRNRLFEHAKEKHSEKILKDLKDILQSVEISDKERYGALIFTGFLKFSSLQEEILACWKNTGDKKTILPAALWAGINCCGKNFERILNPMMDYWASLSDKDDESGRMSEKMKISEAIRLSVGITRKMSNSIVKYLISQSEKNKSLYWHILIILHYIDDPDAVEFVATKIALDFPNSTLSWSIADHWNTKLYSYNKQLSDPSLRRLQDLWENDKNNSEVRKKAFKLWETGANFKDIEKIQNILSESPLFRQSIILRTELKDWSVLPEYLSLILHESSYLYVAHHLWCEDIKKVAEIYLKSFERDISRDFKGGCSNEHHFLSSLIMAIPEMDAEQLLKRYWDHLRFSSLFIHSALYIGTPVCLSLAETAISECPKDVDIFEHIDGHFWINDQGRPRTLTITRLNNLKPYLCRFSKDEIQHLYWTCESCGFIEWARENLVEYLSDEAKKRILISDEDLLQELQRPELKDHLAVFIKNWIEKNEWSKDTKERLFRVVYRLLTEDPSQKNLEIASIVLKINGNRKDLEILEKFTYIGDSKKILEIKEDTRFYVFRKTIE